MLKKHTLFLFLLLLSSTLIAQQSRYVMKPGGELYKIDAKTDVRTAIQKANLTDLSGKPVKSIFPDANIISTGILDTLTYYNPANAPYTSRFGFTGQDVMLTWFVAPAEMVIKAIGVKPAVDDVLGEQISVRLIKFNWTLEQLNSFTAYTNLGYYPSEGDGFNNISAFPEEATGDWVDVTDGDYPSPPWDHSDYDLWSDFGFGWPIEPVGIAETDPAYQWVETAELGEPTLQQGEIFAIAVTHDGTIMGEERIGFWSMDAGATGSWSWKFYEPDDNSPTGAPGWFVREYTFDFVAAVDLIGDRPPVIESVDVLPTTLDLGPFDVNAVITDDNPSGGPAGVASATLMYTINDGETQSVAMSGTEPDFTGQLPAGSVGDVYTYWVEAEDVEGLTAVPSNPTTFKIYEPTPGVPSLVVFNGNDGSGYPEEYYFRKAADFVYDVWAFGPLTTELVNNYTHIFEICLNGPADYNREVIRTWLEASGDRNYFLAGMEWLGADNGFVDQDYAPGSFEYDILGVAHSYNDVSYDGTSGELLPSQIFAQEGTLLGGQLYTDFTNSGNDSLRYDPVYEVGFANWMDAFDAVEGAEVDIMGVTRGIGSAPSEQTLPVAVHQVLPAGNKVAFMTMDPISINTSPEYVWFGDSLAAFHYQALEWFNPIVGVEDEPVKNEFSLLQNYPNPFNPSTTIKYSVVENANVSLKVYDILGKEVATLINETQAPGTYEFDFNASNLASGMYIYTLRAGDFVSSKKMMLLK